jgi:hypothetical protein
MSTTNILINSSNVIEGSQNSKFEYNFPVPKLINDGSIAIHSLQMYYSWFNINAELYNNHQFTYKWWNKFNSLNRIITVTIPNGFYSIESLNLFLQSVMLANGHYIYDTVSKKNMFFIEFVTNATYYAVQLNLTPMYQRGTLTPLAQYILGQSSNSNLDWDLPNSKQCAHVVISASNNFKDLIGFNPGQYPPTHPTTTLYQHLSNYTPKLAPVSSVIIRCNLVQNDDAIPNDILYSFTSGDTEFGNIINEKPNELYYNKISNGTYNKIILTLFDQNFHPMHINDSQCLITLLIKEN